MSKLRWRIEPQKETSIKENLKDNFRVKTWTTIARDSGAHRKMLEKAQHFTALAFFGPILWWIGFCWFLGRNALKNQRKFQEIERNCRNISVLWNGRTKGSCWLSCVASKSPETSQNPRRAQMRAKKMQRVQFPVLTLFSPRFCWITFYSILPLYKNGGKWMMDSSANRVDTVSENSPDGSSARGQM